MPQTNYDATTANAWQLDAENDGPRVRSVAGALEARDGADAAAVPFRSAPLGGYEEVTRSAGQVTDVVLWTDSGKTQKVRETNITRSAGQVSTVVLKEYDGTGALAVTRTGTITRSGGQVANIDWV